MKTEPIKNELFEVRGANEWLAVEKESPRPKMLFGEFWLEGELAIMFADTGKGKSILAVQIAEAIARGEKIEPFRMTVEPQKVLYLDFELTGKQFEMRYSEECEEEEVSKNHYEFSTDLVRAQIVSLDNFPRHRCKTFDEYLLENIERLIQETKARILIIDNLTYLRRGSERALEASMLMKALKELKKEYGLSILVLAHTPKRSPNSALTVNDLQGSKILSNFADNIFAIGAAAHDPDLRYLKHIKLRSTEQLYDALNVPTLRLVKRGGNFLSFRFAKFDSERNLIGPRAAIFDDELMGKIKEANARGLSQREVADELGISKTTVNRYLRIAAEMEKQASEKERTRPLSREELLQRNLLLSWQRRQAELAAAGQPSQPLPDRIEPPTPMNLYDPDDDECDCFHCLAGEQEKCLETDWANQCCNGTDPNCCGRIAKDGS